MLQRAIYFKNSTKNDNYSSTQQWDNYFCKLINATFREPMLVNHKLTSLSKLVELAQIRKGFVWSRDTLLHLLRLFYLRNELSYRTHTWNGNEWRNKWIIVSVSYSSFRNIRPHVEIKYTNSHRTWISPINHAFSVSLFL